MSLDAKGDIWWKGSWIRNKQENKTEKDENLREMLRWIKQNWTKLTGIWGATKEIIF